MKLFFRAALSASFLSTSVMAADPPAAPGPRAGTAEAMQCLVRQGPKGCEKMFQGGAWIAANPWVFHDPERDFQRGPLISSGYRRRALESNICDVKNLIGKPTKEMDIFDAKFAHVAYTFYISPTEADGKIRALTISVAPHDHQLCDG